MSDRVLDYINGAQGTIMFFNMRSALLQTISSANYLNFDFNNPLRAGQAFANQPQYWKDSVKLDETFNKIIEGKTGIEYYKEFSEAKGRVRGAKKGGIKLTLPSAQDFSGLLDYTLGKGKVGEAQREFYNEVLFRPYSRAQRALSTDRVNLMSDFKTLKKSFGIVTGKPEKS